MLDATITIHFLSTTSKEDMVQELMYVLLETHKTLCVNFNACYHHKKITRWKMLKCVKWLYRISNITTIIL